MSTDSTMLRLRRANPVPRVPAGDDADLFARITALPRDSSPPRAGWRPLLRRRAVVLALVVLTAVLLASTAFALSRLIGTDVVRPPVTRQEYLAAQKQLRLPPGVDWPVFNTPPSNSVTTRGGGGGQAVLFSQNAWECYWVQAIRDGDAVAAQRAHAELNRLLAHNILEAPAGAPEGWTPDPLPQTPFMAYAHDGGLDWVRASYKQAAAGNPTNLIESCRANATGAWPFEHK
jgi:hypothetical protein